MHAGVHEHGCWDLYYPSSPEEGPSGASRLGSGKCSGAAAARHDRRQVDGTPPCMSAPAHAGSALWGEKGYIRVRMTGDGAGPCGMYQQAFQAPSLFVKTLRGGGGAFGEG